MARLMKEITELMKLREKQHNTTEGTAVYGSGGRTGKTKTKFGRN